MMLENPLSFIMKGRLTGISDPRMLADLLVLVMAVLDSDLE